MFKDFKPRDKGRRAKRKCRVIYLSSSAVDHQFYCKTHDERWSSPAHGCPQAED